MAYGTRITNVDAHPGWPDLPNPRRSSKDVAEENEKKQQEKDASERGKQRALEKAAMLEHQTQKKDKEEENTRVTRSMKPKTSNPPVKSESKTATSGNKVPNTSRDGVADPDVAPKQGGRSNKRKLDEHQDIESGAAGKKATVSHDGAASDVSELTELEDTPMPKAKKAKKAKKSKKPTPVPVQGNIRDAVKALREKSASQPPTELTSKGDVCDAGASHSHAQSFAAST